MKENEEKKVQDSKRTYHFPGGDMVVVKDVVSLDVRPGGFHRLKTASGREWFIGAGWNALEIVPA